MEYNDEITKILNMKSFGQKLKNTCKKVVIDDKKIKKLKEKLKSNDKIRNTDLSRMLTISELMQEDRSFAVSLFISAQSLLIAVLSLSVTLNPELKSSTLRLSIGIILFVGL